MKKAVDTIDDVERLRAMSIGLEMPPKGFSETEKQDLVALLTKAAPRRLGANSDVNEIVSELEQIVREAPLYSPSRRRRIYEACLRFHDVYEGLDAETRAGVDGIFGREFGEAIKRVAVHEARPNTHKRRRGRPTNKHHAAVAYQVGYTLIWFGYRGRGKHVLSRARTGLYAKCVRIVLQAAGFPAVDDMFPLVAKVAPEVEYDAEHCERPGYAGIYQELKLRTK